MRHRSSFVELLLVFPCLGLSAPAWGQAVQWLNGSVQGNGCRSDDTSIFSFGDEISFVFTRLGIKMSHSDGPKAMNKFCNVSADARVDVGNFVAEFQQALTYGGIKSEWGSKASIMTFGQFYGHHIKPFRVDMPNGTAFNKPIVTQTLTDGETSIQKANWWCRSTRNPKGHLKSRISVTGQLLGNEAESSIVLKAQTFDVKYSASIRWAPCA